VKEYKIQHIETRIVREPGAGYSTRIRSAEDAFNFLRDMQNEAVEKFVTIFLTTRHDVLAVAILFSGSMTESVVEPRHIVKTALDVGATALIVAHNHPSGDPIPSAEDRRVTERIAAAVKLFDISLVDHIIVGNGAYYSFLEMGLLK